MLSSEDVFLYIHAPWCYHCKSLEPILNDVAQAFQSQAVQSTHQASFSHLKIFRIDGSVNEISHPNLSIKGYPMLFYFKQGMKDFPFYFSGDKNPEGIIKFLVQMRKK